MKFFKKIGKFLNSRAGSYIFYVLAVASFVFIKSATFTYSWIAELYPLGRNFITLILGLSAVSATFGLLKFG